MVADSSQLQRAFAVEVVRQLRKRGFESLWAGGCVRDQLLGLTPKDYDVATNARPDEVREVFGKRRSIPIGAAFGVITVLGPSKAAGQVEVATFRTDATYSDGRRPDAVTFSTAEADAQRRDFTINGLFYDPLVEQVIDYVGGQEDLHNHVIRAIGRPADRIAEDKLRMLRGVRFAARFEFSLDAETRDAIRSMATSLGVVSVERIAAEMRLMLIDANRANAISMLADLQLLSQFLPEVFPHDAVRWAAMLRELALPTATFPLALAVLLHHFVDATGVLEIGSRWKLSNKGIGRTQWLVQHKDSLLAAATQPWPRLQRLLIEEGIGELLAMHAAIHPLATSDVAFCQQKLSLPSDELNPPPLITGDDLRRAGIPPGPRYQALLEAVRDAQLTGELASIDEAIEYAKRLRS